MAEFLQKVINGEHCVTSFAGQCGIKTRMMHKYLNGEVTPSLESALLIAAALNMGSHWIWFVNLIDPRLRIILVETSRGKTIPDIDEKLVEKHLKGID
ncbi:MAG: helix-turn-helix transcriptional regulator [Solobacterium sp.]|nr:helix-turn-helix transcriptional regulator [Solobacterium sp.]